MNSAAIYVVAWVLLVWCTYGAVRRRDVIQVVVGFFLLTACVAGFCRSMGWSRSAVWPDRPSGPPFRAVFDNATF